MVVYDAFRDPDRSFLTRLLTWTAHVLVPVAVVTQTVRIVGHIAPTAVPVPVAVVADLVFAVVYAVTIGHQLFAPICLRCMREVPENAAKKAQQRKAFLWANHRPWLLMGALIVSGYAPDVLAWSTHAATVSWLYLPHDAVFMVIVAGFWMHHRLRPWCPYCRGWDDEGPKERVPNPDPSGIKTRS